MMAFGGTNSPNLCKKPQLKTIKTMKSTTNQPLICLQVIPNNTAATVVPVVRTETTKKPSGVWETVGYVNGKPICSCASKDREYNIKAVKEDLADAGYELPKNLAPVMSAKLPKKSTKTAA